MRKSNDPEWPQAARKRIARHVRRFKSGEAASVLWLPMGAFAYRFCKRHGPAIAKEHGLTRAQGEKIAGTVLLEPIMKRLLAVCRA
jgi:hypothetical protein